MKFPLHTDPAISGAYMNQRLAIERRCDLPSPRLWSEASNNQNSTRFPDEDPPFFLRRASSSSDTNVATESKQVAQSHGWGNAYPEIMPTEGDSSTFRSIIDDLTVENRLLKARNKSFQKRERCNQDVDRDKLFEISLHNISPDDAKDLENLLSAFVRSRTVAQDSPTPHYSEENVPPAATRIPSHPSLDKAKSSSNATQSGESSNKVDSGYASMSMTTGARSMSRLNTTGTGCRKHGSPAHPNKRSHLLGVPRGLLPTQTHATTERNKKKLVVQRLEELFTGKKSLLRNQKTDLHGDVPGTPARPLDTAPVEGSREAKIMSQPRPVPSRDVLAQAGDQPETVPGVEGSPGSDEALEQRPTRLLDLDPERQQIPADNVDYMRHLGISTPTNLQTEDPQEAGPDAEGWIYLNLLMNMAQLHIMNVTADFVRDAVEDVSSKFQLSSDGRRLRWRGGTEPTRLSSLSGGSTSTPQSSTDSESQEKAPNEAQASHHNRKFTDGLDSAQSLENRGRTNCYTSGLLSKRRVRRHEERHVAYYSPIFSHPSSENTDTSDYLETSSPDQVVVSNKRMMESNAEYFPPAKKQKSSNQKHRGMVFYNDASFFVDFSGTTASYDYGIDFDDNNDYGEGQPILGCEGLDKPEIDSLSLTAQYLATRKYWDRLRVRDSILPSPDQVTPQEVDSYFDFDLGAVKEDVATTATLLEFPIHMEASCLGCTTPADHFLQTVTTRIHVSTCLTSKQDVSTPNTQADTDPVENNRRDYDMEAAWCRIQDRMADLTSRIETLANASRETSFKDGCGSVSSTHRKPVGPFGTEVSRKIITVTYRQLEPSPAPPPALLLSEMSESTEDDSGSGSTSVGFARPAQSRTSKITTSRGYWPTAPLHRRARSRGAQPAAEDSSPELNPQVNTSLGTAMRPVGQVRKDSFGDTTESSGVGEEEDDADESIDMLGFAREADPRGTSLIEKEWEMERAREMDLDDENSLQAMPSPLEQSPIDI